MRDEQYMTKEAPAMREIQAPSIPHYRYMTKETSSISHRRGCNISKEKIQELYMMLDVAIGKSRYE